MAIKSHSASWKNAKRALAFSALFLVLFTFLFALYSSTVVAPNRSFAEGEEQAEMVAASEADAQLSAIDQMLLEDPDIEYVLPGSILPAADAVPEIGVEYEEGVVLVEVNPEYSADQITEYLQQLDYVATKQVTEDDIMFGFVLIDLADGVTVGQAMYALDDADFVLSSQPDFVYYPFADGEDIALDDPLVAAMDEAAEGAEQPEGETGEEPAGGSADQGATGGASDAAEPANGEQAPAQAEGEAPAASEQEQAQESEQSDPAASDQQPGDAEANESQNGSASDAEASPSAEQAADEDQPGQADAAEPAAGEAEAADSAKSEASADKASEASASKESDDMAAQSEDDMTATAARTTVNDSGLSVVWTDANTNTRHRNDWSLELVNAYEAWSIVKTNKKVTVAILDSGCYVNHPDLKNNIVATYNAVDGSTNVADIMSNTHGTHVAGIIGAEANNGIGAAGVSYNAGLLPVKVMHYNSAGNAVISTSNVVKAYNYLLKSNAAVAKKYNVRVINMSLGKPMSKMKVTDKNDIALINAVNQANDYGIVTVCAAGNVSEACIFFPVDFSDAIVGVINVNPGAQRVTGTKGSNYNVKVDGVLQTSKSICAPGSAVYSTVYADKYGRIGGTSMAAPYVSGVLALMFAANPSLTPDAARTVLYSSAADLGSKGFDAETGYGLVDAYAAVKAVNLSFSGADSVTLGGKVKLTPSTGSASSYKWNSSNSKVATVDSTGTVEGKGGGTSTITAQSSSSGVTIQKQMKVYQASISGASSVTVGSKVTLSVSSTPSGVWTWSSSNAKVASVNSNNGAVKGESAGKATITATLSSNKSIKVSKTITVNKLVLTDAHVAGISTQRYTGSQIKPNVRVVAGGRVLVAGTDYTVTYKNNVNIGTATAVVTGKGSYAGTVNKSFAISKQGSASWSRKYGDTALDTMSAIVDAGGFPVGGTVVLVTNAGYWDALTAAGLAGLAGGPVLMTDGDELSSQTRAQLRKLRPKKIIVCGGQLAVSDSVAREAASAANNGTTWTRIAGDSATGTANMIFLNAKAQTGRSFGTTAFVCTSQGFYDALSAAPVSYAKGMPIFLTNDESTISPETLAAMKKGGITKVYIVGGTAAISDGVRRAIESNGIKVVGRLWGQSAIETSENVAQFGLTLDMNADNMGVATVYSYYDALSGAALCGTNNSILVLVGDEDSSSITGFIKRNSKRISTGYVFGGRYAVDNATLNAIKKATS